MTPTRFAVLFAAIRLAIFLPAAAWAQALPPMPPMPTDPGQLAAVVQRANQNQLGVLEYCQGQGSIGPEAAETQRRAMAGQAPAQSDGGDAAAYAAGRKGTFQVNGVSMEFGRLAASRNMSPDALCRSMAGTLQAQAAQVPK